MLESFFGGDFRAEENGVLERGEAAVADLAGVLNTEQILAGAAGVFLAATAPRGEEDFAALERGELVGELVVAEVGELRGGEQTARAAGVAGDKGEFAFLGAVGGPFQEVGGFDGLAVFVDAEEAHIEVVAGEFEVVGVAAVEGDLRLGGEDEADVGVALKAVEVVGAALIEGDDVAAEAGFFAGFFFDLGDDLAAGEGGVGTGEGGGNGGVDARGDVFDGLEDVYLEVVALDLVGGGFGVEAVAEVILVLGAHLLERVGADVMVGDDEAVAGDEGGGAAAVEADGGEADVVEPGVGEVEAVFGFDLGAGRGGVEPHAFGGAKGAAGEECGDGYEEGT